MSEPQEREERVARGICGAAGLDPDGDGGGAGPVITTQGGGGWTQTQTFLPTWHRYLDEARRFIAAFDAAAGV